MTERASAAVQLAMVGMILLGSGTCARAESVWGYSSVYYDPDYDEVAGIGVTWPDYNTQYYYEPKVHLFLSGTDGFSNQFYCSGSPSTCNYGDYAWAGLGAPPTPGASYTVTAFHYVDVYYRYSDIDSGCMYGCYDWYDAFGYSFDECSPECQADPTCYCVDAWGVPDSWYWSPPMIAVLVYIGEQYLGDSTDELISPVPILAVRNDYVPINSGQTVYLTPGNAFSAPQMPALTARLVGPALTGSTTWRMETQYTGHGRSDSDWFPVSSSRLLSSPSVWDIRADCGGSLRGGTATIRYRYDNQPERSFSFQIRGANPAETDARSRLGSSPWFLTRIARQESGVRQFNGSDPLFGPQNGWGLMQVDPPPGPQEIWSWWANVDVGKVRLNDKNTYLTTTWNSRVQEWTDWNTAHPPEQQVGPPVFPSEDPSKPSCGFAWVNGGGGSENQPSFRDACWIKRYNGLGTEAKDYLIWQNQGGYANNPRWERYNIATKPDGTQENYVQNVCRKSP